MANTKNTILLFRPNHKNLAHQPLTPFSALTPHRATSLRARRLISATTLEMILEEETTPEKDRSSNIDTRMVSLVVFPATYFFLMSKKKVSSMLYGSCKCT
ncbi:unnamed protein product [Cochlearia groenlandica]